MIPHILSSSSSFLHPLPPSGFSAPSPMIPIGVRVLYQCNVMLFTIAIMYVSSGVQGDPSYCSQGCVDIITNVVLKYRLWILKWNFFFEVNTTLRTT